MYSATVVCTNDEVQVLREHCNAKSRAHTIDCARGVWGHAPRILHILKCVLETSEAPFRACIHTYIPANCCVCHIKSVTHRDLASRLANILSGWCADVVLLYQLHAFQTRANHFSTYSTAWQG